MKFLLTLVLLGALLSGCENGSGNPPVDIETSTGLTGVEIVNASDKYDVEQGLYHVEATIKSTGKHTLRNIQVDAVYYDATGHQLATSKGDTESELRPGDKDKVETSYLFPTSADMPTKVILTARESNTK